MWLDLENLYYLLKMNILLGVTGSVATIKTEEIVSYLKDAGFNVKIIATDSALHFFDKSKVDVPVYTDKEEYDMWKKRGDPVLHIDVRTAFIYYVFSLKIGLIFS